MAPYVDFPVFDADNHYYEAEDAFIRHVPKDMRKRCMQWATIDGRRRLLVGGTVNRFIPNPTWDPIARPGSLAAYFRAKNDDGVDVKTMFGTLDPLADHPEYQDRDARLAVMDRQGVEAAFFFPTLGVGMQQALAADVDALVTAFRAFNRWLLEDWGFDYRGRIFASPMITLADVEQAAEEVTWCVEHGARILCMVPGPVPTATGTLSPGWPTFDLVWQRVADAGVTVGFHGGDGGAHAYVSAWEPTGDFEAFRTTPFKLVTTHHRQVFDTMAALICHGVFDRHPNVRVATIETGGMYVPRLLDELGQAFHKSPKDFGADPTETFRRHVWVAPFYEDDIRLLSDLIGSNHLLFGSDWPHAEGLEEPTAFIEDIPGFEPDEVRRIMHDNAWDVATLRP